MNKSALIALLSLTLPLFGCDTGQPPPKLFESQRNDMEKAKGVQDTLQQQADQQMQQIDQQSQ